MSPAVPHRAAAQTRRRLRAGHRAEPVACRCRCRHRRARSFALLLCHSFVRRASPSSGSLLAPTRLHRRRSARTRTYTRGAEPLSSLVLSRSPKFCLFWVETHGQQSHRSEPGMSVPPTCLHRSGPVPLYGALALSKPHRPQSRRPCHDCVVDPLALAVVVLWCILPRHVAPELVIAEPEFRPIATPFFTPNKP
jgi:hypothetical protein